MQIDCAKVEKNTGKHKIIIVFFLREHKKAYLWTNKTITYLYYMKKETLEDLSKKTGYSKTTISRVLNGKGKEFRINDDTCEQIIAAARDLNYRPNLVAQFLRKAEGHTLGVAVPYLSNPFFAQLVSTITIEAKKNNYSVMLFDTQEDANIERKCISAMVDYDVNGIIIAPCAETPDLLEIISKNIPVILIDRYFRNSFLPYISTNNFKGAYDATMTLLNAGHRNILCIKGPETAVTTQEREKGCRKALVDFGKPVKLQMLGNEFSIQNGYTETKVALNSPNVPTAIFTMSTNILLGTIKALHEQNLRIPDDISVVSFDDGIFLDYMNPPITRVAQPVENMALAAVKMIINCIREGKQLQSRIFMAPTLISKESVKIIHPSDTDSEPAQA